MVVMDYRDLLTEVSIFLRVTLAREKLSEHAETCRQQLITRMITREGSPPQAYIDMNGGSNGCPKFEHQMSDCYEEFDSPIDSSKSKQIPESYSNNLYNNLSTVCQKNIYANNDHDSGNYINLKHQSQCEDSMYINPSSPLANTPVITKSTLPVKNSSNSNSERNSIISLKKDSDKTSDSSSFSSSSTRSDESPEVLAMSASALRYAASKTGVLGRREKFFFVDHTKQYWVAVVNQTLFMFNTDKDSKPLAEIDITGYQARPVAITNNKTDFKFELVAPGKKTYQFVAEKQLDMDKWIGAINVSSKSGETSRDWSRQLPSLPPPVMVGLETYDQPDSAARPVVEAEYELPDSVLRSHTVSENGRKPSTKAPPLEASRRNSAPSVTEPRQLPLPPQETYDQPEPGARRVPELYECLQEELYHCIEDKQDTIQPQKPKEVLRRLPSLPQDEETYDQPEPTVRPVAESNDQSVIQEELYSVIDNQPQPITQEAVYRNVEDNSHNQDEDNNYYNLVPSYPEKETEQECIYDVIAEQRHMTHSSLVTEPKKPPISAKPLFISSTADRGKLKTEEKRPFVSNMATIFNKPFNKSQLKEVKPPIINKTCQ